MYRRGAPWEGPPRQELAELVTSGTLTPQALPPGRAIDLGCGSGTNAIFLAEHGFDVTGVDFSAVALAKARKRPRPSQNFGCGSCRQT
jgi:methylase of polypeptide subunit release factors